MSVPGVIETVWSDNEQKIHGKKTTIGVIYTGTLASMIYHFLREDSKQS